MSIRTKKRKILTALLIGILSFISVLLLSIVVVTYLPGVNLNDWLRENANYWFIWRLVLYAVISILVYQIHIYRPLSRKVIFLIALALLLIEGLNWLYRL
ncbi:hypothetical protein [Conservatibacter flavescens]|uniref:Hemophilus-specific protein n=1 Tax=Conservatibacter flavescens TaxID=28161 RepID=A0A2M8S0Y1_9PAST|nr:hypothetical protein [Conservatibacter flavescens]PJG84813.1 hypothetical protein CVP05_09760 [Conservatibacter flavescens]